MLESTVQSRLHVKKDSALFQHSTTRAHCGFDPEMKEANTRAF